MMKNIFLVFLLLFCFASQAQQYHPLLDNTCWYQKYTNFTNVSFFYYYYDGDTLYNAITYKKYRASTYYPWLYLLREDTVQRKVFIVYLAFNDPAEKTLYDFNLTLGAQFTFYNYSFSPSVATVTQIDSVLTNVGYRKRWKYEVNSYNSYYIEQVGSLVDPIRWTNLGGDPSPDLVCNYNGTQIVFSNGNDPCPASCLAAGINETTSIAPFNVYPNPSVDGFSISNLSTKEKLLMEITDVFGKVLYTEVLYGTKEYSIQQKLSPGIYCIRISNGVGYAVQKLIVE